MFHKNKELKSSPVYLDYNASTPIDPRVANVITKHLTHGICGNPSSSHVYGKEAKDFIMFAKFQVSKCLDCEPDQLIFTSGATECLNLVLKGASSYQRAQGVGSRIVISEVENPAVYQIAEALKKENYEILSCPVNSEGVIVKEKFEEFLKSGNIALISIIHANAEIGSIQPIEELIRMSRELCPQALFHVDASQSVGKIKVSIHHLQADFITIAGDKFYSPKGIGCLYVQDHQRLIPQIHGAGQQLGLCGGTENVLLIAALGEAADLVRRYWSSRWEETANDPQSDTRRPYDWYFKTWAQDDSQSDPEWCSESVSESDSDDDSNISMEDVSSCCGSPSGSQCDPQGDSESDRQSDSTLACFKQFSDHKIFDPDFKFGPSHMFRMRQLLSRQLIEFLASRNNHHADYYLINGPKDERLKLPNTLSMSFRGLCGSEIVKRCQEVAFASGSSIGVLAARGRGPEFGKETILLTTGRFSTVAEIMSSARSLANTIGQLYGWTKISPALLRPWRLGLPQPEELAEEESDDE